MVIYLVAVNGKVSQEAYRTLREAYDFVRSRTSGEAIASSGATITDGQVVGYANLEYNGYRYTIHDVRVKD